jgi:hypothetical protein
MKGASTVVESAVDSGFLAGVLSAMALIPGGSPTHRRRRRMMSRFVIAALFVLVAALAFGVSAPAAAHLGSGSTVQAGGTCGCRGTTPVCCQNCNGTFAYCARSYAFCPECPAP